MPWSFGHLEIYTELLSPNTRAPLLYPYYNYIERALYISKILIVLAYHTGQHK